MTARPLVLIGPMEHHSNILCWRESGGELIKRREEKGKEEEKGEKDRERESCTHSFFLSLPPLLPFPVFVASLLCS